MQIRILVLAVAACTESSSLTDAGTDGKPSDAGLGPCAARTLCLQPKLVTTGPPPTAPRLVVAWFQPRHVSGLPPMPVEIGYDVAFVPSLARYDIPLDKVRAPTTDSVLLCQWDQGQCQHTAPIPPIGFALPLVLEDGNGNGHIDASEISFFTARGGGMTYIVWSQDAHAPGTRALAYSDGTPTYLGKIFTQSIAAGVQSHGLLPAGFDSKLAGPDTGDGADFALCPASSSCQITLPRLVGAENP